MFSEYSSMAFDELEDFGTEVDVDAVDMFEEDESYLDELSDEELDMLDEGYLDELSDEELDMFEGDDGDLGEALREALGDEYADAPSEGIEEALYNVMDSLTPGESFSLAKALGAVRDPTFMQIAGSALPLAGGAVGTALGGPGVGTALGSTLGKAAATALPRDNKARSAAAAVSRLKPSATGELPAAAKGLVAMNNAAVQKAALAAALGPQGQAAVNGIPVGAVMNMLSTIFGQAAAEADEVLYETAGPPAYMLDDEGSLYADPAAPGDRARALYRALIQAEEPRMTQPEEWR